MAKKSEDLGLGFKHEGKEKRNVNKDGSFNVKKVGAIGGVRDLYQHLISISWSKFLLLVLLTYTAFNIVFALVYFTIGVEHIKGADTTGGLDAFMSCFFFSAQTFTTVGYGVLSPNGILTNLVASFEAMLGFLSFSLATGLLFGRFSKPNAKFLFSDNILLSPYKEDMAGLMFRVVNKRMGALLEAEAEVILTTYYQDENGEEKRKYNRLPLEISEIKIFPYSWTIVHPIDKESPLYGFSETIFEENKFEIIVLIKALDETYGQKVYSRTSYKHSEFIHQAKFRKAFFVNERGEIELNLNTIGDYDLVDSFEVNG